jgi:hypothetical protein
MKLGAEWMVDVLDSNDWYEGENELVPISEIVPGDTIEIDGYPSFLVDDISMIRERSEQLRVRRYVVTSDEGEAFKLPGRRKVRRL